MESFVTKKEDRMSELPEEIMHQILSLLGTRDAIRMTTLSKIWRSVWTSFPILDFDERLNFPLDLSKNRHLNTDTNNRDKVRKRRKKFINYVGYSLLRRRRPLATSIRKFRLSVSDLCIRSGNISYHIDRWIKFATESNVKELVLHISIAYGFLLTHDPCRIYYRLPQSTVFASKSITVLELKGCMLEHSGDIRLSSLKKLSLKKIYAEEGVIQHLISTCPLLEILSLKYCGELNHPFSAPRLQILEVKTQSRTISVAINAPNIQSFSFISDMEYEKCEINAAQLKTLALKKMITLDHSFEGLISKWAYLESLSLVRCRGLEILKIYNHQLKSLELLGCKDLFVVEIVAPKLLSFKYDGCASQFSLINTSCQLEAELHFSDYLRFSKVRDILGWFGHLQALTLHCEFAQVLIIPKQLRETWVPPLFGLKHLLLKTSSKPMTQLMDSLLWICPHLETLTIESGSTHEPLKFQYKNSEGKEED